VQGSGGFGAVAAFRPASSILGPGERARPLRRWGRDDQDAHEAFVASLEHCFALL
jgi:hypothetical protein